MAPIYIVNSFSLGMVDKSAKRVEIDINEIDVETAKQLLNSKGYTSYIGHAETASFLSTLLSTPISHNRSMLVLGAGEHQMLLVQITFRLGEGQVLNRQQVEELYQKGAVRLLHLHVVVKT